MKTAKQYYSGYIPGVVLFCFSVLISLFVYKDYGVAYDEPSQREIGLVSYRYVFEGNKELLSNIERDHGVGFELPLIMLEKALGLTEKRDIFLMRHLATHIFFLIGVFLGYLLVQNLFKKQIISCIAFLFLLLQPRIYAHSFFNSKDVPFLTAIIAALFVAQLVFKRRKMPLYILLGMVCGYATSIRIMGVLPMVIFCLFFSYDILNTILKKQSARQYVLGLTLFILGYIVLLYMAWPTLWPNPIGNFIESYKSLSHFRWDKAVLFKGKMFKGVALPWTYLPLWYCLTVPVFILMLGVVGAGGVIVAFIKQPVRQLNSTGRNFLLYALMLIAPFVSIIALRSVVYDDWRHIYFVYPPFVLLSMYTLDKCRSFIRFPALVACTIQIGVLLFFFVRNHPLQQVYFNSFASKNEQYLRTNFDYDYWGVSHKQAFEYILATDRSTQIKVLNIYTPSSVDWPYPPIYDNWQMLPSQSRSRIILTSNDKEANYFISTFRYHPQDHTEYGNIYHDIRVQNSTVVRVYKLR